MPLDQGLIKDFFGGDPIAGSNALRELVELGDVAEQELFSRPLDYGKTVQVRRRWLRYVAARESSVGPRLLDRLQGKNEFGDKFSAAFLCAGLSDPSSISTGVYGPIKAEIEKFRPGDADAAVMAYGYAGADGASLWHLINENRFAWEKLSTFVFRSGCVSCARINIGNLWVLEQLITHRWDGDGFELEKVANSPDASVRRIGIDDSEMWGESNHTFLIWRRGDVADQVLRDWSGHAHWRVRWFGAQLLASLGFVRTVRPIVDWLRVEQVPRIRQSLLHALERSDSTAGANALLEVFESGEGEGGQSLAKAGWRASDKDRARKALTSISDQESIYGAEALVSLARLGTRHPDLAKSLESHDHYRRLNAMLALGYLGDPTEARRLTQMLGEAAGRLERIYVSASIALLKAAGAAEQLHRELIAAAEEPEFGKRIDVFFLHKYLQNAILEGLEAGGAQTRELLESWRKEMESLPPIATAPEALSIKTQPTPATTEAAVGRIDAPSSVVMGSARPEAVPASPRAAISEAEPIASEPIAKQSVAGTAKNGDEGGDRNGGNSGRTSKAKTKGSDEGLLEWLGKNWGIGGIGVGVLLILYRALVFPKLEATQANLFMILIFGVAFVLFAIWAWQLTKRITISVLILVFGIVIGFLGRSMLRASDVPIVYQVRVRAIGADQNALQRAHVNSSLGGETKLVSGGWEVDLPAGSSDDKRELTIEASVEDLGLTGSTTITLSKDPIQTTSLELKKRGELPVRGIVEDGRGNSIPNALVSVVGYGKDAVLSDGSGNFEMPSHAEAGETISLHVEKPGFKPANIPNFKVGSEAATLTLGDLDATHSLSSRIPITGAGIDSAPRGDNTGSTGSVVSPRSSNPASERCDSFQAFQGDEAALATLAEKAFSRQSYDCTITYLEQARKVQSSRVWERDYPLLAASYLLARKDRGQFKATLQEMLGEMRRPNSFLHHEPAIGFALANITNVRFYVDPDGQSYLDEITTEAIRIKQSLAA
ncbi:carboxypeptidase-like regulatory domain-containing protein [Occallatibacter riparius]|uniref:Carboxypeptidase-like regulatory domain-containing protein n=1 Tax=Occallatibacter riparius TaxID=1002689 RepID=A0A9J7BNM9_9BACT|nr:carboxypeptidase-like regulatory domain-containing protein [Occallatibacter riparius]UWZ84231.1 carboxypeptidase-like regulatory domain-containing protein [Occallatibacter riparius]